MPLPENHDKPSTKHHVTDARFAAILGEDFAAIPTVTIFVALEGEPQKQAISICEWAIRTDDPSRALLAWARKHHKGRCRRAARTTTERPTRRHGTPRDDRTDDGRGSGPARTGGIDPAFVRANLEKMEG